MNKTTFDTITKLNCIYSPLLENARKCERFFANRVRTKIVWANNHYEKYQGEYVCELFPVPVVEAENIGDIGFNITGCFYEGYFSREKLLTLNTALVTDMPEFAIYGESDCLKDICNAQMSREEIARAINDSSDKNLAVSFYFAAKDLSRVTELLMKFALT